LFNKTQIHAITIMHIFVKATATRNEFTTSCVNHMSLP
ncbi:MAG: hypothetical protein ACJA08_003145, partial [Cyclobacteriaceae bacterium]